MTVGTAETIYALSSAPGRAGVAVIRISGPEAGSALQALTKGRELPAARTGVLRKLTDPVSGDWLDSALVLFFPAPNSFTGEEVVELHLHGGKAVVDGVIQALAGLGALRPAEAGEFTRRAFHAGRMDLTEIEGLSDLIDAETSAQRRQALTQMSGHLSKQFEDWRHRLIRILAHIEAELDFPDEDLPDGILPSLRPGMSALAEEMSAALADEHVGERIRDGVRVVLLGAPNAGKSSLLNRLAARDVAIVSEQAGTTRDVIEVHLDLDGLPVILTDTAGLREAGDAIEREGMKRALARAETSDLKLLLVDGGDSEQLPQEVERLRDRNSAILVNKIDQSPLSDEWRSLLADEPNGFAISARTGEGLEAVLDWIRARTDPWRQSGESALITRHRHRVGIMRCEEALRRALIGVEEELAAEDVRIAAYELGRLTGRVDVEDLLDVIFRDFCIGK